MGQYTHFYIQRDNWQVVCKIAIHGILNDCTDGHAKQGKNHYRIGAEYSTGALAPADYYADTLEQDRMYFLTLILLLAF